MCRYKKDVEELKETQVDRGGAEIFMLNTPTKTREKVKINWKYFYMQEDIGSDVTLIPVNFRQDLGKLRLTMSPLQLKQFDGTIIQTLGTFKGMFETKNCFEMILIMIMACTKDHGLLGIDVLKVDTSKLVDSLELEEQKIKLLKSYKASIRLKENYHPSKMITYTHFTYCSVKVKTNGPAGYFRKGHSWGKWLSVTNSHH